MLRILMWTFIGVLTLSNSHALTEKCSFVMGNSADLLGSYTAALARVKEKMIPLLGKEMNERGFSVLPGSSLLPPSSRNLLLKNFSDLEGFELRNYIWLMKDRDNRWGGHRWLFNAHPWRDEDRSMSLPRELKMDEWERTAQLLIQPILKPIEFQILQLREVLEGLLNDSLKREGYRLQVTTISSRYATKASATGVGFHVDRSTLKNETPNSFIRVGVGFKGSATIFSRTGQEPANPRNPEEVLVPDNESIVAFTIDGHNPTWHAGGDGPRFVLFFDAHWVPVEISKQEFEFLGSAGVSLLQNYPPTE